jgi:hypothetical protein
MLSARYDSSASGSSRRWRTAAWICARTNSIALESRLGATSRSANIAHVESNVALVARRPILVQSTPAATSIALPSAAMRRRRVSRE